MRFAFVAAGAVSLAAIALGGVTAGTPTDTDARGAGSNVTPMRTQGTGAATAPESQRRRGASPLLAQGQQRTDVPVAPTSVSAPLLPGVPAPSADEVHTLTTPVLAGAAVVSPLIRPLQATSQLSLTASATATAAEASPPALLAAPSSAAPSVPATPAPPRSFH
jgi:hypothetical protein